MRVSLAGSLTVQGRQGSIGVERLPGRQGRVLLAYLVAQHDRPVPREELANALWGNQPPPSWENALAVLVSKLRAVLTESGADGQRVLTNAFGCYQLTLPHGSWVDLDAVGDLVDEAEEALADGRPGDALDKARMAAELARPSLLPGEEGAWVDGLRARLRVGLIHALDCLSAASLATGNTADAILAAKEAVELDPFRETGYQGLMRAFAAAGNRAGALRVFNECRTLLADELGVDPDPATQQIYLEILRLPASAEPPAAAADRQAEPSVAPVQPPAPAAVPAIPARRTRLRVAVVVATVGLAIATTLAVREMHVAGSELTVPPNTLVAINPVNDQVVRTVGVGARPGDVVSAAGSLWVANLGDGTVSQIGGDSGELQRTVLVGESVSHLAAAPDGIWVSTANGAVEHVDATFGAVTTTAHRPDDLYLQDRGRAVSVALGSLWLVDPAGEVDRMNPATGALQASDLAGLGADAIAVGAESAWVANASDGTVTRIDRTNAIAATVPVGHGPSGVAIAPSGVWVTDSLDGTVVHIDADTNAVLATVQVGGGPGPVVSAFGSVWVANTLSGTISRVDPNANRVVATVPLGVSPGGLVASGGSLWVTASRLAPVISGGGVLHLALAAAPGSVDPAVATYPSAMPIEYATCAKLLNYPDLPAPQGFVVAPEVAESVPVPTDGGTTYRFVIRPGYRFAPPSGEAVTAQTFADTIERVLSPQMQQNPSDGAASVSDIVGAAEFGAGKARHVSGLSVNGNVLTVRLVRPAANFVQRIAMPTFCAVPSNAPRDPNTTAPIPSAGPYTIASYTPGQQIVLRANPYYKGSRPRHFDEIVYRLGVGPQESLDELNSGATDYVPDALPDSAYPTLAAKYGPGSAAAARGRQRYFIDASTELRYLILNTSRPLFAGAALRRAVSYAIDRSALADEQERLGAYGNMGGGAPYAGYLPPGFPGSEQTSPYPLDGPDLSDARRLAAGNRGEARLYTCNQSPCLELAAIVKTDLAAIGIGVDVLAYPKAIMYRKLSTPGEPYDIATVGWNMDFPDPSDYLAPLLDPAQPAFEFSRFDDPKTTAALHAAETIDGPARYTTYGRLADEIARRSAPMIVYSVDLARDYFSDRIGCQLYQPVYGMDLTHLCLRP